MVILCLEVWESYSLQRCDRVSTTAWINLINFNETLEEKSWLKLHKSVTCSFDQILEAAPLKTTAVQPPIPYFAKYRSMMTRVCWALLER